MIEMKKVPDLLISLDDKSLGDENHEDGMIRENSYDESTLRILVFIFMLIKSKYILEILDDLDLIYVLEALRDLLVSEIETLEDGQRNQYLQELSAFEEFFANLS